MTALPDRADGSSAGQTELACTYLVAFALCLLSGRAWAAADSIRLDLGPALLDSSAGSRQVEPALHKACERCAEAPKIDGSLADSAWQSAARIEGVARTGQATTIMICFDGKALYVAAQCRGKAGRKPRGEARPRDGKAWADDCIELWLELETVGGERDGPKPHRADPFENGPELGVLEGFATGEDEVLAVTPNVAQ